MEGFIKDYRQELDSDIWKMPPLYHRVWQWLKYQVNHTPEKIPMKDGTFMTIQKGQRLTSIRQIADGVSWYEGYKHHLPNPKTISNILDWLEKQNMIQIERGKGNRQYTLISLINWDLYQAKPERGNSLETAGKQCADINKNEKNEKNEKNTTEAAANVNWYDRFHECFNRIPNEFQREDIIAFLDDGVEEELLILAFEKAALKNAPYRYAQTILKEWIGKGIKTIEQGKAESEKFGVIRGGKQGNETSKGNSKTSYQSTDISKLKFR